MADWTAHNNSVFSDILRKHSKKIEDRITQVLNDVAVSVVAYVEGSYRIPMYTGNLADSTGVGVYRNGRLAAYAPTKRALVPQTYQGRTVWGDEELAAALNIASSEFAKGLWVVLFSAVPYAVKIEGKYDYFAGGVAQYMAQEFQSIVRSKFPELGMT